MRWMRAAGALCAAMVVWLGAAEAKWREVRTENFRIVTDSREEKARRLATELETYRAAVLRFLDLPAGPEPVTIEVVLHERRRMFSADFDGIGNAGGIYSANVHGPAFAAWVDKERDGALPSGLRIMKHELVHHLMFSRSKIRYPIWYSEGYAEFISTLQVEGDRVVMGAPPLDRLRPLHRGQWYGGELYESKRGWKAGKNRWGPLYAQSWLTVHYLLLDEERRRGVPAMLNAVDRGIDPAEAMKTHLGVTTDELAGEVRAYWTNENIPLLTFVLPAAEMPEMMRVRTLTGKESYGARQKVVARFRMGTGGKSDNWRRENISDLERYLKAYPDDLEAHYWIASHRAMNGEADALRTRLTVMRALDAEHPFTLYAAGRLSMLEAERSQTDARDHVLAARDAFREACERDPSFARAHLDLARTWLVLDDEVTQEAVDAIERADQLSGNYAELPFVYGALLNRAGIAEGRRILTGLRAFGTGDDLDERIGEELAR